MKYLQKTLILFLSLTIVTSLIFSCATSKKEPNNSSSTNDETNENLTSEETFPSPENEAESSHPDDNIPNKEDSPIIDSPNDSAETNNISLYIRCTTSVNIRAGAGTNYSILGTADKDSNYVVIEKIGNWYKTYYKEKVGYIYSNYVSEFSIKKSENTIIEKVLSEGYKLLGTPYVYGAIRLHDGSGRFLNGFTKTKFDCSSLTQYIFYYGANTLLQTTTRSQVIQGTYVLKSSLQRGDCIYFTNSSRYYNVGIDRIGHVAVYLGNDYILHTSSDYARIEKMNSTRWEYYIESRRFI